MFLWCTRIKFINLSNITYKRDKINAITKRDPILYRWIAIISYTLAQKTNCNWKTTCLERLISVSGLPLKAHQRYFGCMEVCTCNSMLHMTKIENRVRNSKVSNQCLLYTLSVNAINIGKLQWIHRDDPKFPSRGYFIPL